MFDERAYISHSRESQVVPTAGFVHYPRLANYLTLSNCPSLTNWTYWQEVAYAPLVGIVLKPLGCSPIHERGRAIARPLLASGYFALNAMTKTVITVIRMVINATKASHLGIPASSGVGRGGLQLGGFSCGYRAQAAWLQPPLSCLRYSPPLVRKMPRFHRGSGRRRAAGFRLAYPKGQQSRRPPHGLATSLSQPIQSRQIRLCSQVS